MNTNDEILDLLIKRDLVLQRVGNGLSKDVADSYIQMTNEALDIISKYDISLINMNKVIRELDFNYDYSQIQQGLTDTASIEASFIPNQINSFVGVDIVSKTLSEPIINKIVKNSILSDGYTIKEGFEKLDVKVKDIFQNQIRLGVLNGDTTQQIVSNLKPYLTDLTDNKIYSLVNTSLSTVVNNVRMETYSENEEIFKGYQHHSTLDFRTTYGCANRDGANWDLRYKGLNKKGREYPFKNSPLHYNCRSIILPITKSYKELGLDMEEIPDGTRSSLDGAVPATMTFDKWFAKQSEYDQKKYLGRDRYQLYKDGKITLNNLVTKKGETTTVKELAAMDNKSTIKKQKNSPSKNINDNELTLVQYYKD